jgi:hypothetical protein
MRSTKSLCLIFLLNITIIFAACTDPCKDKDCYNGYCIEGDCFCLDGYSGENCEIRESDKFVGNYSGKQICQEGIQSIKVKVSNKNEDPRSVLITLDNFSESISLRGNIRKDSIFIPNQWVKVSVGDSYITNLFNASKGIILKDSILRFDLIYYFVEDNVEYIDTCRIEANRN